MIVINKKGKDLIDKGYFLKKLLTKFSKALKRKYGLLGIYIGYVEDKEEDLALPEVIIGIPDEFEIKDTEEFMKNIGNLLEESGNLAKVANLFLLSIERKSKLEEELKNAVL